MNNDNNNLSADIRLLEAIIEDLTNERNNYGNTGWGHEPQV